MYVNDMIDCISGVVYILYNNGNIYLENKLLADMTLLLRSVVRKGLLRALGNLPAGDFYSVGAFY